MSSIAQKRWATVKSMQTTSQKLSTETVALCEIRLDRLFLGADGQGPSITKIPGFRCSEGHRLRPGPKLVTYRRMKRFKSETGESEVVLRYEKSAPWIPTWRIEMRGDDQTGITPEEIEAVLGCCLNHKLSLVELAFDFAPETGIDAIFVLRHGLFGKSRREKHSGGKPLLRYGGRACPKFVRCYQKTEISRFRVELEIHSALLRKHSVFNVSDLGTLCPELLRSHICFVGIRWRRLDAYLEKKFGTQGRAILEEAQERATISLRRTLRFLSRSEVANPHRFLRPLRINDEIAVALRAWHARFSREDGE
jgi:hypothetical protein